MPVLDRAVTPCSIDQPERGEIDNGAQLLGVNADSVAEQFAHELRLLFRAEGVAAHVRANPAVSVVIGARRDRV